MSQVRDSLRVFWAPKGLESFTSHVLLCTAPITCLIGSGQTDSTSTTALGGHPLVLESPLCCSFHCKCDCTLTNSLWPSILGLWPCYTMTSLSFYDPLIWDFHCNWSWIFITGLSWPLVLRHSFSLWHIRALKTDTTWEILTTISKLSSQHEVQPCPHSGPQLLYADLQGNIFQKILLQWYWFLFTHSWVFITI